MASGWNLWVWLQCIGVASRCCCREVYRYPHNNIIINFPYSTCIRSFLAAASLLLCSFLKCFFGLVYLYITRTMQGILLTFHLPTVDCLWYCAVEVMTDYTQFCIEQFH